MSDQKKPPTTEEILAAQHDYDGTGPFAKCRKCGRAAVEVRGSASPTCKGAPEGGDTKR